MKGATKKVESDVYAAAERTVCPDMNKCISIVFKVLLLLFAQYQNSRSSSEELSYILPYKEPSAQLDQLYDDLATMQCLEIPRKFLEFVQFLQ